jgi:uncharacterized protein (DUF1015 family)
MDRRDPERSAKLRLRPFRAMRYNRERIGDLSEVTSPPYDMMDRRLIGQLLDAHPNNVVRLILPRMVNEPVETDNPYAVSAKRLARWRASGVLRTDPTPALYVYEYGDADHRVCGLVGALELRKRTDRAILPHEGVIREIVIDRLAMMSTAEANLEPILLVYDGGGETDPIISRVKEATPLLEVSADDGSFHRLWAITDEADLRELDRMLSPHQALIADGHHRYATYLQLRRRHRRAGDGPGPWDRGLAMLIDQSVCPLQLGAIHRSLAEARLGALVCPEGFTLSPAQPVWAGSGPAEGGVVAPAQPGEFLVTDGVRLRRLTLTEPRPHAVSDAELLHQRILPAWGVADDRIGYHHSVEQTLQMARQDGGVGVLMHPASVAEVMEVARAGKTMPRKSTSFGPKPRMGLIMRSFADEP